MLIDSAALFPEAKLRCHCKTPEELYFATSISFVPVVFDLPEIYTLFEESKEIQDATQDDVLDNVFCHWIIPEELNLIVTVVYTLPTKFDPVV